MPPFSALQRPEILKNINAQSFDLLVIGGGITGCGIALDAAARGLKTVLIEKGDFASGTSSRSTKLIHGGLRYLKQFEIALVREVGMERAKVHKIAPHLVSSEKMLLPILKDGSFSKMLTSFGLFVYDVLAGVERADQRKMYNKEETLDIEPLLPDDRVEGGALYAEYRTDDARLTIEIIKTAVQHGALAINYVEATDFLYDNNLITGIKAKDHINGQELEIHASYTVSAAGPWVDELRQKNNSLQGKHLFLSKGVHIVVDHERLPVQHAVYFDVPDGRMIFAIPRGRVTYIGTTDTPYQGDKDQVHTNLEDVHYLLDAVNHTFKTVDLTLEDVQSSWAGLRPLIHEEGKSASEISRKDEVFESETGLISIAGGKLTGYRKMAQKVVDLVAKKMYKTEDRRLEKCRTDKIPLQGGLFANGAEVEAYIKTIAEQLNDLLPAHYARYLVHNYGRQTEFILEDMHQQAGCSPEEALAIAESNFCISQELTQTASDFFLRRTGRVYFDIKSIPPVLEAVLKTFQEKLKWPEARLEQERQEMQQILHQVAHFEPSPNQV